MLAADKLLLKGRIAQKSVVLKEKEFTLHHRNFTTVGTQAAVLAGFSVTALVEFVIAPLTQNEAALQETGKKMLRRVAVNASHSRYHPFANLNR